MGTPRSIDAKIIERDDAVALRERLSKEAGQVVFTNGCFDILHIGHIDYLHFARSQGDLLIVGLNSDASVSRFKGPHRPIVSQAQRARVLAALESVDYVLIFDDDEPLELISDLLPDVLVKGEDWAHYVAGSDIVEKHGGKIVLAPLTKGSSSTNIVERIKDQEA